MLPTELVDDCKRKMICVPAGQSFQRSTESGFTLVEMLVVIAIIGLVMGMVGPRVLNYLGDAKVKAAKIQIESFGSALDLFFLDAGRYPTSSEGLGALSAAAGSFAGPFIQTQDFTARLVVMAVIGGAASVAGGVKFANGVDRPPLSGPVN